MSRSGKKERTIQILISEGEKLFAYVRTWKPSRNKKDAREEREAKRPLSKREPSLVRNPDSIRPYYLPRKRGENYPKKLSAGQGLDKGVRMKDSLT